MCYIDGQMLHNNHHIPKHNDLIIGRDMNVHINKGGNNKFCHYNATEMTNFFADFSLENRLACLNTKYRIEGKLRTIQITLKYS